MKKTNKSVINIKDKGIMYGNKGEWSELYVFFRLLSQGYMNVADENAKKIEDIYYPVYKIFREDKKGKYISYEICEKDVKIYYEDEKRLTVSREELKNQADLLFDEILKNKGSFQLEEIEKFANEIMITKIKSPSTKTSDIKMQISNTSTGFVRNVDFSIKSELGKAPTLFNASQSTNFVFKVDGISSIDAEKINKINTRTKVKDRIAAIYQKGGRIKYDHLNNNIFERNLLMIESQLPRILGEMLIHYYSQNIKQCDEIIKQVIKEDSLDWKESIIYEYKIKEFLCACALGMKPNKKWDGINEITGGYIIIKSSGEIVTYYIYNIDDFKQYLFDHTFFEKPSTSRNKYMELYEENGEMFIKLNLQIRFNL